MGQGKAPVGGRIGSNMISMGSVDSTNAVAMELGEKEALHGTVVVADLQTQGRGRLGRSWVSPRGNIHMSVLLRPALAPADVPLLTMTASVGCARALREIAGLNVEIKWPNDLMVSGRKLGGILTEAKSRGKKILFAVVGIGINANSGATDFPPELWATATSLRAETGIEIPRNDLVAAILAEIEFWYGLLKKGERERILDEWRKLSSTLGRSIRIVTGKDTFEGVAEALDREGRLIVKLPSGALRVISAGDIIMLR